MEKRVNLQSCADVNWVKVERCIIMSVTLWYGEPQCEVLRKKNSILLLFAFCFCICMLHKAAQTWKDLFFSCIFITWETKPVLIFSAQFIALVLQLRSNEQKLICRLHFDCSKLMIFKQISPGWKHLWSESVSETLKSHWVKLAPRRSDRTKSMKLLPHACFVSFFSSTWAGLRWKCSLQ